MSRRKRDPGRSRELILRAATSEFARRGPHGARVDRIAKRCGFGKNLIYHYFGSKDGLFLAVLERAYGAARRDQRDLEVRSLDPVAGMRELISHTFWHIVTNPALINLLAYENLEKGRHVTRSGAIRRMYRPLLQTVRSVLRRGQALGVFRPDVDPVNLYITICGLAHFYMANRYTLSASLGRDLGSVRGLRRRHAHIVELVLGYLAGGSCGRPERAARRAGVAPRLDERLDGARRRGRRAAAAGGAAPAPSPR